MACHGLSETVQRAYLTCYLRRFSNSFSQKVLRLGAISFLGTWPLGWLLLLLRVWRAGLGCLPLIAAYQASNIAYDSAYEMDFVSA